MPLVSSVAELGTQLPSIADAPLPDRVLLADPRNFELRYAINPHMREADGSLKQVDRMRARQQWEAFRQALLDEGLAVAVIPPLEQHPDLVFCANPALPIPGSLDLVLSRMAHGERRGEVAHLAQLATQLGYTTHELPPAIERFEGSGDGIACLTRRLLLGGVGPRTEREAWDEIGRIFDIPIVVLTLIDPDFYHLDTAISVLDRETVLWFPAALDERSRALIEHLFTKRIEAPESEARRSLACNAFATGRGSVFVEGGARRTRDLLQAAGFRVIPLDSSEFLKSGGSLFCMKLAL